MRVLMLSWEYPPVVEGGLGRHVGKLSERLAAAGVEVHVLARGSAGLAGEEERRGVSVHRVSAPAMPYELDAFLDWVGELNARMARRGDELCRALGFDLVHSHDWLVADTARQLSRGHSLPWVVTVHATEFGRHGGWVHKQPQSHIHSVERAMARRADQLITCSDYMAAHVSQLFGIPRRRIATIPNAVDPVDFVSASEEQLLAVRARYAKPDQMLLLMVGRLVHEKGFQVALEAIAPLVTDPGGVRFVVAGTGPAQSELEALVQRLDLAGHGSFVGRVDDELLHSLYRVADITIVPSLYEPFGIVALEAMASGGVCVVSDTGGLREVAPDDRRAGIRFPTGDAEALRTELRHLLSDRAARARIGARAREHALQFSWARSARRTEAVYQALIGSERRGALSRGEQGYRGG